LIDLGGVVLMVVQGRTVVEYRRDLDEYLWVRRMWNRVAYQGFVVAELVVPLCFAFDVADEPFEP